MNLNDAMGGVGRAGEALPSAARTAAVASADIDTGPYRGIHVVFDVTAIGVTPSVTLTIQGKDESSGKYYTILAGAAVVAVTTNVYRVFPGAAAAANAVANDALPRMVRISMAVGNAVSMTYSVGYSLIP